MSFSTILVLLTSIIGLYTNPAVVGNQTLKAEVDAMAAQVMTIATQAMSQPSSTAIGEAPTSSVSIVIPTSTENPTSTPITVTVNPSAQQQSQPTQNNQTFGAVPTSTQKTSVEVPVFGFVQSTATSTRFEYQLGLGNVSSSDLLVATVTVGSTTYPMVINPSYPAKASLTLDNAQAGLAQDVWYTVHEETATQYTDQTGQIVISSTPESGTPQ